jgi:hypothetical protein
MPADIKQAQEDAMKMRRLAKARKSDPTLVPLYKDSSKHNTVVVSKPGRPAIKFVDVGGKFVDVKDAFRRIAERERRARAKERRRKARH